MLDTVPVRLLVTGGRRFEDRGFVFRTLDAFHSETPVAALIHGACPTGADLFAKLWAQARNIPDDPYPARWDDIDSPGAVIRFNRGGRPYNVLAGFQRNAEMLRRGCPTHAIAFDGDGGTNDMVQKIKAAIRAGQMVELTDLRIPRQGNGWSGNGRWPEHNGLGRVST